MRLTPLKNYDGWLAPDDPIECPFCDDECTGECEEDENDTVCDDSEFR